jgi:hypothetical protein
MTGTYGPGSFSTRTEPTMMPAEFTSEGCPPSPKSARGWKGTSAMADDEMAATAAATKVEVIRNML